jgi:hypothetical protein
LNSLIEGDAGARHFPRPRTGIDLDALLATAELCEKTLGRELHGLVTRGGLHPLLR